MREGGRTPGAGQDARDLTVSLEAMLDGDGSDAGFRQLMFDLLSVSAQSQSVRAALGRLIGLTGAQYSVMMAVRHMTRRGEGVTVSRLAERLNVSGTFVTAETRKLEALGLLEKAANPLDGRSVLLQVTEAGRAKLQAVTPAVRKVNDEIFRNFDRAAFEALAPRIAELARTLGDGLVLAERLERDQRRATKK